MKKSKISFVLAGMLTIAFAIFPTQIFSAIFYVDQDAAGANNGSSWSDAFTDLQDALAAASYGDEIWVAQGVYKPSELVDLNGSGGTDPREAVFLLPDGVAMYGGFNGTEGSVDDRDWATHLAILSGDIDNNDINSDGNFIAENISDINGNNSYHVLMTENADTSTRVDGFIITAGKADISSGMGINDPNLDGGGWYNLLSSPGNSSSPTIENTVFTGNYAESEGGAFYTYNGALGGACSSVIKNCVFKNNESGLSGGALYIGSFNPGDYNPEITNCKFEGNEAYRSGGAIYLVGDHATVLFSKFEKNKTTAVSEFEETLPGSGGAVALVASNASFTSCMFTENSATGNPTGPTEGGGGGAVYASTNEPQTLSLGMSSPRFVNCGFYSNSAEGNGSAWGGALTFKNDDGILQPSLVNCVFNENYAQDHGGAVYFFVRVVGAPEDYMPALTPEITNCTFYNNSAGNNGGGLFFTGFMYNSSQVMQAEMYNSIVWGNNASNAGDEIFNLGSLLISHSLIGNSGGSGGGWDNTLGTDGGNNIDVNPGFINAGSTMGPDGVPATSDDGLRLSQFSNAVNGGINSASGLAGILFDYTGNNRILGGTIDIGAYERTGFIIPDFDLVWVLNWPGIEPPCLTCPLPWSFLLFREFGYEPQYIWKEPGKFIRKGNSATITGEIVHAKDKDVSFKVYLKLEREQNWKTWSRQKGSWFAETKEANKVAKDEHVNWKFWTLSPHSYLEGTGKIEGVLRLKQWNARKKTGFQMGSGANGYDGDFGIGGFFNYNGRLSYSGKKIQVHGQGSFNADGSPCEEDCEKHFHENVAENNHDRENKEKWPGFGYFPPFKFYPVPAGDHLIIEALVTGKGVAVVKVIDSSGRIVHTVKWNTNEIRKILDLNNLKSGLYFLHITTDNEGKIVVEKFIKK